MTIVAGADKDSKGMTGDCTAADGIAGPITRTCQMAIDALHISLDMDAMRKVLGSIEVTTGAQGIRGSSGAGFLGMHLVTVNASHIHLAVAARSPFEQRAGVTGTAQVFGPGDQHMLLWVFYTVGPVAGLTGDAGQHKLSRDRIIAGGVAGKAFPRLFRLLQINLEDWIK